MTLLFEKKFDGEIRVVRKINNNSFGIVFGYYLEIYNSIDNFENISLKNSISEFQIKEKINTPERISDFIQTSDALYIIIACFNTLYIYKSNNFSIFKEIKLPKNDNINIIDDNKIILSGKNIGIFTINDSSYKLLFDEKIKEKIDSYLGRISNYLNYSNFVIFFNKLICKRQLETIESTSFEDDDDKIMVKKALYIFDYNLEKKSVNLSQNFNDLKVVNIYKNFNDEIIIIQEKKVSILYI